jgi:hypothetical protein
LLKEMRLCPVGEIGHFFVLFTAFRFGSVWFGLFRFVPASSCVVPLLQSSSDFFRYA